MSQTAAFLTNQMLDQASLVTAEKVVQAVEQIVAKAAPLKVIAFGPRARGDHRIDCDLDLAVIVEKYDQKTDQRPVWRAYIDAWMSIDLFVFGLARHEFTKDSIISVHHDIANEGVSSMTQALDQSILERLDASRDDEETIELPVADRIFGFHAQQAAENC